MAKQSKVVPEPRQEERLVVSCFPIEVLKELIFAVGLNILGMVGSIEMFQSLSVDFIYAHALRSDLKSREGLHTTRTFNLILHFAPLLGTRTEVTQSCLSVR